MDETKICSKCSEPKPISDYYTARRRGKVTPYAHCKACHYKYKRPDVTFFHTMRYNHGVSKEEYLEMYEAQAGLCAICGTHEERLNIDHCHNSSEVRGLLCRRCNVGLGWFQDDVSRLKNAIKYLEVSGG